MIPLSSASESTVLAPSSAVPGWTAEYAVPLGGPGHLLLATFEQAAIGIAHLTLEEEWISVNQRLCEITGYKREEILQFKVEQLTHPDDVAASVDFIRRIKTGEISEYKMEKRYVRKDGRVIWVNLTVSTVLAANGLPLYIVAFIEDITLRREAESDANRSLSLLRATLESTADGILVVDRDGKILNFNQKMADMWEIPADVFACGDDQRAINAALEKLVYPDEFMTKVIELYRHPEEASYDVLELKDGRTFERYSQPQYVDDVPVGRVWSFRDVTSRRRAEEQAHALAREQAARAEAEASRRRAALLAEASRVLSASFDYETTLAALVRLTVPAIADYCAIDIVEAEDRFERIGEAHVDPEKDQLLRQVATFPRNALTASHPLIRVITTGEPVIEAEVSPAFIRMSFAEESQRKVVEALGPRSLICVPLVSSGKPLGALTLVTSDTSGRRFTLADLSLAADLARRAAIVVEHARLFNDAQQATRARDDVLAVVAHDLRNPLNTVWMAVTLMLESTPPERVQERRQVEIVRRAADRMNRMIQDLLDVKRMESGRLTIDAKPESATSLINDTVDMLRPLAAGSTIRLETSIDEGLPPVLADSARIQQVLSNLVGNAVKFTPRSGRITVCAERIGEEVRFGVIDTGPGIPAEQLPHIFGRFWQARTDRRGIGLGLAIAKGIVEAHNGRIWVESHVGLGSTFYFTLPGAIVTAA